MILRGCGDYVYFTSMRTNRKWPVEDMAWDNGLLVANHEKDGAINGSFEFRMAIEAQRDRRELVPDHKIINPTDPSQQLFNLPASSGGL
jgi:hypothetical protein